MKLSIKQMNTVTTILLVVFVLGFIGLFLIVKSNYELSKDTKLLYVSILIVELLLTFYWGLIYVPIRREKIYKIKRQQNSFRRNNLIDSIVLSDVDGIKYWYNNLDRFNKQQMYPTTIVALYKCGHHTETYRQSIIDLKRNLV